MKRLLMAAFGAVFMAGSAQADTLSDAQVLAAVDALSGGDQRTVEIARDALAGDFPEDSRFSDFIDDYPTFAVIAASLDETGRVESLDWEAELIESIEAFERLFLAAGFEMSDPRIAIPIPEPSGRWEGVETAYFFFRHSAEAVGMRLLGLNADSDMYHFVLAPEVAARRWTSVRIGDNQYIEDSDWQFLEMLEALGVEPRSRQHPSETERPAP